MTLSAKLNKILQQTLPADVLLDQVREALERRERQFTVTLTDAQIAVLERLIGNMSEGGDGDEEWNVNGPSERDYANMDAALAALQNGQVIE
jgi:hypothetical protein